MKKTMVMLIVLATILALSCGCTSQSEPNGGTTQNAATSDILPTTTEGAQPDPSLQAELAVERIATIPNEWKNLRYMTGGVVYEDSNGMLGIMSADGRVIGEAKYVYCKEIGDNFQVATNQINGTDIGSYNRFGVVNAAGVEQIPMQYAYIRALNERYYYVSEVTGIAENRDEALLYATDSVFYVYGAYIQARNHEGKYVLLDLQGNTVSSAFDDSVHGVYGELLQVGANAGSRVCTFSGSIVYEGDIQSIHMDEQWGNAWIVYERIKDDYVYTMIDQSGTVLYQTQKAHTNTFTAYITQEDQTSWYYCMADQDFTLKGVAVGPWLISNREDTHEYTLVDTVSGTVLVRSNWDFNSIAIPGSVIYVYTTNADDALEIYTIKQA